MADLTAIILTMNEESNIGDCILSIKPIAKRIVVVDSGSRDRTEEIARNLGADFYYNPFVDYATQFNWGIDNTDIDTQWILRIDADERFTPELCNEVNIETDMHKDDNVNGMLVKQKVFFINRWLLHGEVYPFQKLLIFKRGLGRIEIRKIDEHTVLSEGIAIELKHDAEHYAIKNITNWIAKHNWYASRTMQDYFEFSDKESINTLAKGSTMQSKRKQKAMYYRAPIFIRPFILFIWRYIFKLGFLDGKPGFIYHFMLNFWYRELVDAKIYEHKALNLEFENTGALKD